VTRYRNLALFLALAALWGAAFVAIKAGLDFFPPVLFAALRYDVAGALMLGYAVWVTDRWRPRTRPEWVLVGVGGTFMIAAYHAFLFVGELNTTSAAAAVVVSLSPVLTAGFSRLYFPDEPLTPLTVVGLLLGLVGVGVLNPPDPNALLETGFVANVLVFFAATTFAFGSVLTRRIEADLPIETMEAWSMLLGAGIMHAVSVALPSESLSSLGRVDWGCLSPEAVVGLQWSCGGLVAGSALAYLSLGASAVGFLIYFDLLDRLGPVEINLVSYVAPVAAAVVGVIALQEAVDLSTAVGFLIIFSGFALIKRTALATELGLGE